MIVHIAHDDKFIDMAYREFEDAAPGNNKLVMLGKKRTLHYVKSEAVSFYTTRQASRLVRSEACDAVVFHSLNDGFLPLLKKIPCGKKVFWLGWGYDYYQRLLSDAYPDGLLMPRTRSLLASAPQKSPSMSLATTFKSLLKKITSGATQCQPEILARVDYFSPVLEYEHQMACRFNSWFKPKYLNWNYGTAEDDFEAEEMACGELGENILIGNSATYENNHLEVFEVIDRHVDVGNRKIIVPLSYGDELYRDKIISYGHKMFGDKFIPLSEFINKESYMNILQGCGYVFMNHIRQQGVGNVCIMMMKGAKVYLNSDSPLYSWFKEKGGVVESVDSLVSKTKKYKQTLLPLSEAERRANARVVRGHWGREVKREKTRNFIDIAMEMI